MVRLLACLALAFGVSLAAAQPAPAGYPSRPIRILVPTPPGGGADTATRLIAKRMSETIGQPVLVENRPGAGGNVAAEYVARAPADGYTIYMGAIGPMAISPGLYRSLPFDPVRDFVPITMSVVLSNILVAHPSVPARDVRELIAYARSKPGALNYGSSGNATAGHLAGELFNALAGVELVHVPYKGGGPAMADLLAGQIQLIFASAPSAIPHIKAGRLHAIGVTTLARQAYAPDIPTLAEGGLAGFDANNWYCFVAPSATPPGVVRILNREFRSALGHPPLREAMLAQGLEPAGGSPEELAAYMRAEMEKWGRLIRARRIAEPG